LHFLQALLLVSVVFLQALLERGHVTRRQGRGLLRSGAAALVRTGVHTVSSPALALPPSWEFGVGKFQGGWLIKLAA